MNIFDKPNVKNTASLLCPVQSQSDSQADILRDRIVNAKSKQPNTNRVWYVSNSGNDANRGNTPQAAWETLAALNKYESQISEGDSVLFERGGVFRGQIKAKSGVFYGAYGAGEKPCIYSSKCNYASADWEPDSNNLWKINLGETLDIGIIVFNHGEKVGSKVKKLSDIKKENDFYSEGEYLWISSDVSPAVKYTSIEMGALNHVVLIPEKSHDITIDNLTIKYTGGNAITGLGELKNITISNCEIGWIGGSYLPGFGNGTVRFGNGIEFWTGCENCRVENNWMYQIYDSGFSHQGRGVFEVKDLVFTNNLIEYTSLGSIEYWAPTKNTNRLINIEYSYNILRFAGYGWSEEQRPDYHAYHLCTTRNDNYSENFLISNNIFDTARHAHFSVSHFSGDLPNLKNNTFIAKKGDVLGYFTTKPEETKNNYIFDNDTEEIIHNVFKDVTAKAILI